MIKNKCHSHAELITGAIFTAFYDVSSLEGFLKLRITKRKDTVFLIFPKMVQWGLLLSVDF